jgi:hypothetical protein
MLHGKLNDLDSCWPIWNLVWQKVTQFQSSTITLVLCYSQKIPITIQEVNILVSERFLREKRENGTILVDHVGTADNEADILTKALSSKTLKKLSCRIGRDEDYVKRMKTIIGKSGSAGNEATYGLIAFL